MANQVVVQRGKLTAPDSTVAVSALPVSGVIKALADGTPLHGEVVIVIERGHFVDAPRERTVVEDNTGGVTACSCVTTIVYVFLLSTTESHKAYNNVVALFC